LKSSSRTAVIASGRCWKKNPPPLLNTALRLALRK
jgi:hypothetical protein